MSVRVTVKDGILKPLEPLPPDWQDGDSFRIQRTSEFDTSEEVEQWEKPPSNEELDAWMAEMEKGARAISPEDHVAFLQAIEEHRQEAKQQVRREWGLE